MFRGCMLSQTSRNSCEKQTDRTSEELICTCQSDKCNNNSWGTIMGATIMVAPHQDNQIDYTTNPTFSGSEMTTDTRTYNATDQTVVNRATTSNHYGVALKIVLVLLFNIVACLIHRTFCVWFGFKKEAISLNIHLFAIISTFLVLMLL